MKEFLDIVLSPLGVKGREFTIDYLTKDGDNANTRFACPDNYPDGVVISGIVEAIEAMGGKMLCIWEAQEGYTLDELEKMPPHEIAERIKLVALNDECIGGMMDGC